MEDLILGPQKLESTDDKHTWSLNDHPATVMKQAGGTWVEQGQELRAGVRAVFLKSH